MLRRIVSEPVTSVRFYDGPTVSFYSPVTLPNSPNHAHPHLLHPPTSPPLAPLPPLFSPLTLAWPFALVPGSIRAILGEIRCLHGNRATNSPRMQWDGVARPSGGRPRLEEEDRPIGWEIRPVRRLPVRVITNIGFYDGVMVPIMWGKKRCFSHQHHYHRRCRNQRISF